MKPLISVTIMIRDTGPILDELLKRLAAQDIKWSYELVVLYFGKGRKTLKRLIPHVSRIIQIRPEEFDCGRSRDLVCSLALGKYIVTLSVDALPVDESWLQELISPLVFNKADVVQGELRCPNSDDPNYPNFFYWENNYILYYSSEEKRFLKKYGDFGFSCVNLAFRKKVWENSRFTGASYCEDKLFQKRVFKAGYVSVYNPKAVMLHAHSYTKVKKLFQRIANEGLGWKEVGENYGIGLLLKDFFRIDMHLLAINAFFKKRLKYNSEILFFFIRPIALYWGNKFRKTIY
ncbi:MAG: glycosyltransferase [Patescibacteria group bacterium]